MSSYKNAVTPSATLERLTGCVKWFNNKAGFGFITVTDGPRLDSDIFVHHSAIKVENQQYRYLIQGEYVEFDLTKTPSGKHEYQAANVFGIRGGKLMCETRHDSKMLRNEYNTNKNTKEMSHSSQEVTKMPREKMQNKSDTEVQNTDSARPKARIGLLRRPRNAETQEKKDWTLVSKNQSMNKKSENKQ